MTSQYSKKVPFLLALIIALSSAISTVTAFVPICDSRRQSININSRLFESIIEAEDRYYEQAAKSSGPLREKPPVVYTVVYNPGTPEEGIHTMKYPRGSDNDVLLAFEGMADCIVFARTIKEDPALDQEPVPTPTSREMVQQACDGMGIQVAYVPMESQTQW